VVAVVLVTPILLLVVMVDLVLLLFGMGFN
jgi:hypothetical protein